MVGIIWTLIPAMSSVPVVAMPIVVLFAEVARYGFWKVYTYAYSVEAFKRDRSKPTKAAVGFTTGWSFGATKVLLMSTSLMFQAGGPGIVCVLN